MLDLHPPIWKLDHATRVGVLDGLRAEACPSPPSVRHVMRDLADDLGATRFHVAMLAEYLRSPAHDGDERGVYYVDNHVRPYTGKFVIRRGWRMQDKRVRPGITDYYVHDEDGRPLFRVDVASHDSLTQWLGPIGSLLRRVVGEGERVLLAFDRAGAFAESMASLRDAGFELVTYERRPFPILAESAFTERAVLADDDEVRFMDARINLGARRGRVRRIAVREADGRQVNLLAVSELPAARLIAIMRGRWRQENGFKHGVERWGINQLDRRKTVAYPPDTIVPNPRGPIPPGGVWIARSEPPAYARGMRDGCSRSSPTVMLGASAPSATSERQSRSSGASRPTDRPRPSTPSCETPSSRASWCVTTVGPRWCSIPSASPALTSSLTSPRRSRLSCHAPKKPRRPSGTSSPPRVASESDYELSPSTSSRRNRPRTRRVPGAARHAQPPKALPAWG
jgi:hypothetical protein